MRTYQHNLTETEEKTYRDLEAKARAIASLVDEFDLSVLQSGLPMEVQVKILDRSHSSEFGFLAYMMHPQGEWTGGNGSRVRPPHIANW